MRRVLSKRTLLSATAACSAATCSWSSACQAQRPAASEARGSPPLLLPSLGPKTLDTVLAGLGLWGGCAALGWLEPVVGRKLFAPPMMASGIIFFYGPEPPHPEGFLSGTLCSATLTLGTFLAASKALTPVAAQGAAAASLLMWYKTMGAVFPPAAVLAGALPAATVGSTAAASARSALHYLVFPWLAGHGWLYACASAVSKLRSEARVAVTARELLSLGDATDDALRGVFDKFDTNGDGGLDASELKVALRGAVGLELSLDDCRQLVAFADRDGTGRLEFDEFRAVCRGRL